jgi:hypothetical protein
MALSSILTDEASAADQGRRPRVRHVIYLHMAGAPPQQDLWDRKPLLNRMHGEPCPKSFIEGKRLAFIRGHPTLLGSPFPFFQAGESGRWISSLLPHLAGVMDDLTIVRSVHTEEFNHAPADLLLLTGTPRPGGASLGAWCSYGLGSLNRNLPDFVVMVSGGSDPTGGMALWGSGFLPSTHEGTPFRGAEEPVLYLGNPEGVTREHRDVSLRYLRELNEAEAQRTNDAAVAERAQKYELAFRMQKSVPGACDLSSESEETRRLYGASLGQRSFANHCLLARRLVERGVRFVQLFDWGWDVHGTGPHDDLLHHFPSKCREIDRPIAALVQDLKRRGLWDETLLIWGGEFGRTAMVESRGGSKLLGRDHHPDCFTMFFAGGCMKSGFTLGETCELGVRIVKDPVSVRDVQATILHAVGLDPYRLRFPYLGLEQRLIGPADGPRVLHELFS